jgi:broad specificity phosphatase PhoE
VAAPHPQILLVRHGETEWSRSGKHTGRTDIPLTAEGRRQGELLGARLAGLRFERVLTSPLERAAETCRLAGLGDAAETRSELLEWDYGRYEGLTTPEIRADAPGWNLWRDGCPGGETASEVGRRADSLIAELRTLEADAIVFAHGHLLRVLAARWLTLPPQTGAHFALSTAAVSVLGYERDTPVMWLWNGAAHLATHAGASAH